MGQVLIVTSAKGVIGAPLSYRVVLVF